MSDILVIETANEGATKAIARAIAPLLRDGDIVMLSGDLGAGKSVLARAIIQFFCPDAAAPSPTFTFLETYDGPEFPLWHFDLYRLEAPDDVWELGVEDALEEGLVLVEWPERAPSAFGDSALTVRFDISGNMRKLALSGNANWARRIEMADFPKTVS